MAARAVPVANAMALMTGLENARYASCEAESTVFVTDVQAYVENLDVQLLPIGIESTSHYTEWTANYTGANPFPIDIIVDKQGIVRYVAREYDAPTMHAVVQELLAE